MRRICFAAVLFLAGSGCGYHVAGGGDLLPKTLKTIAIPAFGNITTRYELARMLPEDIAREFLTRTRYKVVADQAQADAVLTGAVLNFVYFPTTQDAATGRATAVIAAVTVQLTMRDRSGTVLFSRPAVDFRERYEISENPQQYFDESGTAMIRMSKYVAQNIVSAILQNF